MTPFEPQGGAFEALEEHAQDLFEHAPCGYLSATPDGTLLRVNQTFLDWTGYAREELVGVRRFQDLLSVGGRIYHETHYAPLLRMQGAVREIALDVVAAGGDRLPVLVNSVLVHGEDGTPIGVRTVVLDARERRAYERELLAARDRERVARERTEALQGITAVLAGAPDAAAAGTGVVAALSAAFGADRAGLAVPAADDQAPSEPLAGPPPPAAAAELTGLRFDEGPPASVRLPCGDGALLWLEWDGPRTLADADRGFLLACATLTGAALQRLAVQETTREVAHELQRSLLADDLPSDPRVELATVYHAAVAGIEVGGDWYDAFELSGDRLAVVVGDVVGRGLHAASTMGQLRSAVRALAAAGFGPAALLAHLDTFVEQVEPARYATLIYAEVDPGAGRATFASAGHLPAVLVAPDGRPDLLLEGRSAPLGVEMPGAPREQADVDLAPGAGFVFVTDGLIERRGEVIDTGLERLVAAVAESPGTAPRDLVAALLDGCLPGAMADDDVCLLSLRRRPE